MPEFALDVWPGHPICRNNPNEMDGLSPVPQGLQYHLLRIGVRAEREPGPRESLTLVAGLGPAAGPLGAYRYQPDTNVSVVQILDVSDGPVLTTAADGRPARANFLALSHTPDSDTPVVTPLLPHVAQEILAPDGSFVGHFGLLGDGTFVVGRYAGNDNTHLRVVGTREFGIYQERPAIRPVTMEVARRAGAPIVREAVARRQGEHDLVIRTGLLALTEAGDHRTARAVLCLPLVVRDGQPASLRQRIVNLLASRQTVYEQPFRQRTYDLGYTPRRIGGRR